MIRVLFIVDNLDKKTGVATIIYSLYKHLDKRVINADFLVSNKSTYSYESEIKNMGGNVFYSGNPLRISSVFKACRYNNVFFKNNSRNYDIIHLNSPTISEMTIRYAKQSGCRNIIIHSHSSMFSTNILKSIINFLLTYRIKSLANNFWFCSKEAAIFLYGNDYKRLNNTRWIRNAVDVNVFTFNREIYKKTRTELDCFDFKLAVHISNFSKIKNTTFLVEVIKEVINKDSKWRFIFVGDGPERSKTETMLKKENMIDFCIFIGYSDEVSKYLNACDLLLLPSLKEGLPIVTIEAQAVGLKCFVTETITHDADVGNIEYLELNTKKWVDSILSFSPSSVDTRECLSSKFKESDFNIVNEAKRLESLYKQIVSNLTICQHPKTKDLR